MDNTVAYNAQYHLLLAYPLALFKCPQVFISSNISKGIVLSTIYFADPTANAFSAFLFTECACRCALHPNVFESLHSSDLSH